MSHHEWGRQAIDLLEERVQATTRDWTTEQLAEFWHGATEGCTLRLVRLKPELVRRVDEGDQLGGA